MPDQLKISSLQKNASFIGLQSYSEAQADHFFGRDTEIEQLTKLVEGNSLTTVFGKSGTGKTSLLNAGVFPRLRKNYCLPFRIRLEFRNDSPDLIGQVKKVLREEIDKYGFHVENYPSNETLWEYFHKEPLWRSITPILIFDQFEEIYTLAQKSSRFRNTELAIFWDEISDIIENSIPGKLKDHFLNNKEKVGYNYSTQKVKAVFAFREEYLPEFEHVTTIMPSLKSSRFRLLPMSGAQAYEVITKTWGNNINPAQADRIVQYFTNEPGKATEDLTGIEPSLLSQVCTFIETERIQEGGKNISAELLDKYPKEYILRSIYNDAMVESNAALSETNPTKPVVKPLLLMNAFVENNLITDEGYRSRYKLSEKDMLLMPGIDVLTGKYLLRQDENTVELTHDVLTPLIKNDREKKLKLLAEKAANKKAWKIAGALVLLSLLAGGAFYYFSTLRAENRNKDLQEAYQTMEEKFKTDSLANMNLISSLVKTQDSLKNLSPDTLRNEPVNQPNNPDSPRIEIKIPAEKKAFPNDLPEKDIRIAEKERQLHELGNKSDARINELKAYIQYLRGRISEDSIRLELYKTGLEKRQKEFDEYRLKYPIEFPTVKPDSPIPDENSLILNLNIKFVSKIPVESPSPLVLPENLSIYLIPDSDGNQKVIRDNKEYELFCNENRLRKIKGVKMAVYYKKEKNYFFNNVPEGKYLIKICSYYGNYKMVSKGKGRQIISMLVSPPLQ